MRRRQVERLMSPLEITSPRLLLRTPLLEDAPAILAIYNEPEALEFAPGAVPRRTVEEMTEKLEREIEATAKGTSAVLHIFYDDKLIGTTGLNNYASGKGDTGILLSKRVWGKGLAVETLYSIYKYAFETMSLDTVESRTLEANSRMVGIFEQVFGLVPTKGMNRGYPDRAYAIHREEFPVLKERVEDWTKVTQKFTLP